MRQIASVHRDILKQGLPKHIVRKKLPRGLGYGLFLHPKAKPLLKGEIIGSYAGEAILVPQNLTDDALYAFEPFCDVVLAKEQQALFDKKRAFHPRRLYAFQIDALKKGNFTRFINHSSKPNLVADFYRIPKNSYGLTPSPLEIVFKVEKTIHPGEQLLFDYDGDGADTYWSALDIAPIPITPTTFRLSNSLRLIGHL
ncbi:MAG: SET domain-containing protein [Verrucomicrobia bacterium]|nr:SET domain-containing protein [Verrucomicrobiota bacterium]